MAETIAVLSQKGGTGKTTAVRTLTDIFRRAGLDTLAVDLDPQGNLSDYFDVDPDAEPTVADVLAGRAQASEAVHDDVIPANLQLAEAELALGGKMGRELTLRRALRDVQRATTYSARTSAPWGSNGTRMTAAHPSVSRLRLWATPPVCS